MSVATGPGPTGRLSRGDAFALLCNDRRRYLVEYLLSADPPVELGELATRIAARECGTEVRAVTAAQRKRVYTTLQQLHLPKLDEAGVVDYDADRGVVDRTDRTGDLVAYVEVVPGDELPWREYYLALGAVFVGVAAALWAGVYPLTAVPPLAWTAFLAAVLALSATVQVFRRRFRVDAGPIPSGSGGEPPEE